MALIDDIEAFLEKHEKMSATALGDQALGDRHFVRQVRSGRRVWPETEAKVRAFMDDWTSDQRDTRVAGASSSGKVDEISRGTAL